MVCQFWWPKDSQTWVPDGPRSTVPSSYTHQIIRHTGRIQRWALCSEVHLLDTEATETTF